MRSYFVYLTSFLTDRLRRDDRGATAVEYGLIVALIAVAIIFAVTLLGQQLVTVFNAITTALGGV